MKYRFARPLLAALCLAACATGATAVDLIPTADFARRLPLTMPRLSPDGKHFSVVYHDPDGKSHGVAIYPVDNPTQPTALIRMPPYELPAEMVWASPTRLVVARGKQDGSIGNTSYTGEIMAVDINGKNPDYLYGYEAVGKRSATRQTDSGWGEIEGTPAQSNGHFYMRATSWSDQDRSTLYDVDATSSTRKQMADIGIGGNRRVISKDDFSLVTAIGLWTPVPLRPFGTYAESGIPKVTYVDPQETISKLHGALSLKFPGSFVNFIDFSEDGSQLKRQAFLDKNIGSGQQATASTQ